MTDMLIIDTGAGTLYAPDWQAAAKLHAAVAAAYKDITGITKAGQNTYDKYKYITYDDVADPVRKAMASHNLTLYCGVCPDGIAQMRSENGKNLITRLSMRFALCETTGGAMMVSDWESEAADSGLADKGINKALTAAQKYYLMRLFMIAADDDADQHGDNEDQRQAGTQLQPQRQTPAAEKPARPADPETVRGWLVQKAAKGDVALAKDGQRGGAVGAIHMLFPNAHEDAKTNMRHALTNYFFGKSESAKLTGGECAAIMAWATEQVDGQYRAHPMAVQEAAKIIESLDTAQGQQPLM